MHQIEEKCYIYCANRLGLHETYKLRNPQSNATIYIEECEHKRISSKILSIDNYLYASSQFFIPRFLFLTIYITLSFTHTYTHIDEDQMEENIFFFL